MTNRLLCFGNTANGELGLGGIEEEHILTPRVLRLPHDRRTHQLLQVSSGKTHTLLLMRKLLPEQNLVFSCGSGPQLGRSGSCKKLESVKGLSHHNVVQIACGAGHSLALTDIGQIFAWGDNKAGQLGLDETELIQVLTPKLIKRLASKNVIQIACGANHSMALTKYGECYSWGCNAFGQLGLGSEGNQKRTPQRIISLQWTPIQEIVCGGFHSAVLTNGGALYMFGKNKFHQLGLSDQINRCFPTLQLSLKDQMLSYVSLGDEHSAAITQEGGFFTWGAGSYGQVGHGRNSTEPMPRKVFELMGNKILQVSCGRGHTFVVTEFGKLISFGLNASGQLGIGSRENKIMPTTVPGPWIEINAKHLLLNTDNKELIVSPAFESAPTDSPATNSSDSNPSPSSSSASKNEEEPKPVDETELDSSIAMELDEENIEMDFYGIGVIHTLDVLVEDEYEEDWRQELATKIPNFFSKNKTVTQLKRKFVEIDEHESEPDSDVEKKFLENREYFLSEAVASRGDQSFVILQPYSSNSQVKDCRHTDSEKKITVLDNSILESFKQIPKDELPPDVMDYIEAVMSSGPCWNASYTSNTCELDDPEQNKRLLAYVVSLGFSPEDFKHILRNRIDFQQASIGFKYVEEAQNERINRLIYQSILNMLENVPDLSYKDQFGKNVYPHEEVLRIYLILPFFHLFKVDEQNQECSQMLINKYVCSITRLNARCQKYLKIWFGSMNKATMKHFIDIFMNSVHFNLKKQANLNQKQTGEQNKEGSKISPSINLNLGLSLQMCRIFFDMNKRIRLFPHKDFYINGLAEMFDLRKDYFLWKTSCGNPVGERRFYLCDFAFIFDSGAKNVILTIDSEMEQVSAARSSVNNQVLRSRSSTPGNQSEVAVNPFVVISVHRNTILQESINQLCIVAKRRPWDLKRPLQVFFEGEEAIDAGQGMKKEFFLLLMKEILDEKYGMFTEYKDTATIWFHHATLDDTVMYQLIGILCGLAIYNKVIINLPFPLILYKKILEERLELEDLAALDPILCKNFKNILDPSYSAEEFHSVFDDMNFTITLDTYGHPVEYELCNNGKSRKLTYENRAEYVELYWRYLLETSVQTQFKAFQEGFMKVLDTNIVKLFHAEELMQLVSGQDIIDWEELETSTKYKEPFKKDHETVKLFWRVFHAFTKEEKKKWLLFLTGSDRIPITGVKALKIVIQPMRVSEDHLPVVHTCFNLLDIPMQYECENPEEKLREKFLKAFEFVKGFALV